MSMLNGRGPADGEWMSINFTRDGTCPPQLLTRPAPDLPVCCYRSRRAPLRQQGNKQCWATGAPPGAACRPARGELHRKPARLRSDRPGVVPRAEPNRSASPRRRCQLAITA